MSVRKKYILLQGTFWILFCISGCFVSLLLQEIGVDNRGIGMVTAGFGLISALLQPIIGRFCDRSSRINWKHMILFIMIPFFVVCVFMLNIQGKFAGIICVGLLLLLGNMILPFVNAAMSYYQAQNIIINYGVARGVGSALFAVTAYVLGRAAEQYGTKIIPVAGLLISMVFIILVSLMPCNGKGTQTENVKNNSSKGFIKQYPAFMIMFFAFVVLSTSHNIVGTYLLQVIQSLGGGSKEYGNAIAIQAIVEVPILFVFSWLLKRIPARKWMLIAATGYAVKAICYAMITNIIGVYLVQFTQMFSFAIFASSSVYYVLEVIKEENQVTGIAIMSSILAFGTVIGSLLGGWIIDLYGIQKMLYVNVVISLVGIMLAFTSDFLLKQQRRI